ncbi:MAG: bi-domain-containing oxidoreductase [Anaerolineaceae bacterium]|nr:bi-domain-containing oxidoreductase [Anaerolineaceae bacterium]
MKQVQQNMRDGKTTVMEVPIPKAQPGTALVRNAASLVSAGTERMLVEFAEKSLIGKAQSRPDLVKQVINKVRREGIFSTLNATFNRLDKPMPLGYSSAGTITEVGQGLQGFKVGDRVACAGGGYAVHAEYVLVPQNLMVKLPDHVNFDEAAFTTLGAIAMQGFRLAEPQLGERVAIIGLGLLGLLSVGIARAAGCQVFGVDLDPKRVALGKLLGAECVQRPRAEKTAAAFSQGQGFDAVLICADSKSNDPIELAANIVRDKGTVISVGAVGLDISRKPFFDKEINFMVSRSYGPGRYDPNYEEKGLDYPIGYVRWTEGRNLQSFVDLLANQLIQIQPIISHRFSIEEAEKAYALITGKTRDTFLGVVLTYDNFDEPFEKKKLYLEPKTTQQPLSGKPAVGVLGAGNYANATFLPAMKKSDIHRIGLASGAGLNATHAARKFGFQYAAASDEEVISDSRINTLAILTRHNLHHQQISTAMATGKHVYCEKPAAITLQEVSELKAALEKPDQPLFMIGFNRRFAPLAQKLAAFFSERSEPLHAHFRVNAGFLPKNHWTQDPDIGGGRIIGEGCHFIDFITFIVGAAPLSITARALPDNGQYQRDNVHLLLTFPDGSLGSINYLANGDKSVSKEYVEVFCEGKVGFLHDFRKLELIENGSRQTFKSRFKQDKGHAHSWQAFVDAITSSAAPPIPYDQLLGVSAAAIIAEKAINSKADEIIFIPEELKGKIKNIDAN